MYSLTIFINEGSEKLPLTHLKGFETREQAEKAGAQLCVDFSENAKFERDELSYEVEGN